MAAEQEQIGPTINVQLVTINRLPHDAKITVDIVGDFDAPEIALQRIGTRTLKFKILQDGMPEGNWQPVNEPVVFQQVGSRYVLSVTPNEGDTWTIVIPDKQTYHLLKVSLWPRDIPLLLRQEFAGTGSEPVDGSGGSFNAPFRV